MESGLRRHLPGALILLGRGLRLSQTPNVAVPFEESLWDHVPPSVQIDALNPARSVDVYEYGSDARPLGASIDVADASTSAYARPDGRVP
ncbi:MAG TPA: hypothetical protein VMT47_07645 [Polyangia bacterium]|nr:hypothetical protein [Polyangia bacterium]